MKKLILGFEDLECWKACRVLRLFVAREVLPALPACEKFRLGDQVLRAARSTTANIAEGYGRFHYGDNAKFLSNTRGSLQEVLDHLICGHDELLIPATLLDKGRQLVTEALKLTNGYLRYLRQTTNNQ